MGPTGPVAGLERLNRPTFFKPNSLPPDRLSLYASAMGIPEAEKNINNKIARCGFTAAFMIQCLKAIGAQSVRLVD